MLAEERRIQLVEWSNQEGRIDALDAANRLNVAVETVRRDLDNLQRRGLLRRVHGGAIANRRMRAESTLSERRASNNSAKRRIAAAAAVYLPDAGCIFVDGGTTTEYLAEHLLQRRELLVVTNNAPLATRVAESGTPVHLLAGRLRATSLTSLGSRTVDDIGGFRAQMVFLGANGISPKAGFTSVDQEESAAKQAMIRYAEEHIVLADATKFGARYSAAFATTADIDRIVTDIAAPQTMVDAFVNVGVEVVIAQ